ncbi:hypothetical protein AAFF_G00321620 [Aldrovandia affinis]|uniref:Uncharacterized protein n=1 Tax=Aldrovandia affinis TaxID=143900 RepID=A0AAD7SP44_9TELE|nr:hypothetical protein AAFF_G00321620 [Aldrovandia affinis]
MDLGGSCSREGEFQDQRESGQDQEEQHQCNPGRTASQRKAGSVSKEEARGICACRVFRLESVLLNPIGPFLFSGQHLAVVGSEVVLSPCTTSPTIAAEQLKFISFRLLPKISLMEEYLWLVQHL